ncbi:GNAT family N-acetyltransferase [Metabacillus herbersteinensis]|uniref:GNAT family N-acetyltransferase n=1 Tax=Metabacillus herbersteinensis TaxID=283816 RepID=A0ABV6GBX0_9BACI
MGVEYWGKGYTTEAARRIICYGFQHLQLNKIFAATMSHNPASSRVMKKVDMTYEGTAREHVKKWGNYVDLDFYTILRSEWDVTKEETT